jgi:hypothetical protein
MSGEGSELAKAANELCEDMRQHMPPGAYASAVTVANRLTQDIARKMSVDNPMWCAVGLLMVANLLRAIDTLPDPEVKS